MSVYCSRKSRMLLANTSHKQVGAAVIVVAVFTLLTLKFRSAQRALRPESEGKQVAEIAGVKFASPRGFKLEQSSEARVAFMRHATSQTALFVTVTDHRVNDKYLTDLSNKLVSQLFPQESDFAWKILHRNSDRRRSRYQTSGGTTKGLNETKYVQTDYLVIKAQGHDVIVGSISTFGEGREAKFLFEVEGREHSFLGWQGLFELISSITDLRNQLTIKELTRGRQLPRTFRNAKRRGSVLSAVWRNPVQATVGSCHEESSSRV